MAFRQIINKVLTRLREDTITSDWTGDVLDSDDVDDYQKLISEFVNESKQLVEDSWGWGVLRTIETVTTSNGTASYTLSNLNDRSRILQVIDDTNDAVLSQMSDELSYNIRVHAVQPQDDLGTAASTLKCPEHIVVLGAYALAIAERGEDGGLTASTAGLRFQDALSDAIVQDQNRTVNETTWYAS